MLFDPLPTGLSLLLNQTILQPVFEGPVAFLLLDFLFETLLLFISQLLLLFQRLSDQLSLLPLVHAMSTLLVFIVKGGLLKDHLLVDVSFGLVNENFTKTFLMLLNP